MNTGQASVLSRHQFDRAQFLADLTEVVIACGVTWSDVARATGVLDSTLCRMRLSAVVVSVVNFLALCHWAGLDPMKYLLDTDGVIPQKV